jgi:acyl dehydratase
MSFGRYFDEFQAGQIFEHWPGRTVNDYDSVWFSLLSMNQHPLYVDEPFARKRGFERRPAAESFVFSLVVGMSVRDTSGKAIANLGFERVVFEKRVFAGDTLRAESEVLEARESASKQDRGLVRIETRAFNQNGERVIWLRRTFLAPKRSG